VAGMKIFVINLKRSVERRAFMQKQLASQQLDFEFIQAIDGAELQEGYLNEICNFEEMSAKRPWLLRRGVYGCLLSHLSVYKKIVDENIPYALVLEDDVEITSALKHKLSKLSDTIKDGEAILLFLQNNHTQILFSYCHTVNLQDGYRLAYPMKHTMLGSAAAYILTHGAASRLIDTVLPIRYAADDWGAFYEEKALDTIRCVTPFLIKPAGLKSSIDYIEETSMLGKIMNFVDKKHIFPFKQILNWRRRQVVNKTSEYSFVSALSPLDMSLHKQ
jgi:glycosyl transferase family 25